MKMKENTSQQGLFNRNSPLGPYFFLLSSTWLAVRPLSASTLKQAMHSSDVFWKPSSMMMITDSPPCLYIRTLSVPSTDYISEIIDILKCDCLLWVSKYVVLSYPSISFHISVIHMFLHRVYVIFHMNNQVKKKTNRKIFKVLAHGMKIAFAYNCLLKSSFIWVE